MFTRQHYVAIAKKINKLDVQNKDYWYKDAVEEMVDELSDMFQADNPRFDEGRFRMACFKRNKKK